MKSIADIQYWNLVSVVEDGGLSWLRKSYQRMKEQAEKQNRRFEDIVAERYGVSTGIKEICIISKVI